MYCALTSQRERWLIAQELRYDTALGVMTKVFFINFHVHFNFIYITNFTKNGCCFQHFPLCPNGVLFVLIDVSLTLKHSFFSLQIVLKYPSHLPVSWHNALQMSTNEKYYSTSTKKGYSHNLQHHILYEVAYSLY